MAAIVGQVMGNFIPEILQRVMFRDVISIYLSRLGGANFFAQGCKAILVARVATAKQTMSHPVRSLCPPPDIALESIC